MTARLGFTIPASPLDVRATCDLARRAEELGYTDAWSMETNTTDGFSPAAAIGASTERLRLGSAIVPVYSRPAPLLAMSALAVHQASGGRFCLGLGASSPTIVERWMGRSYDRPLTHMRETISVIKQCWTGDKVNYVGETFSISGFRLEQPPEAPIPIFLAALGPRMLALAEAEADGVALFLCNEEGVRLAKKAAPTCELMARIMCLPDVGADDAMTFARRFLAPYVAVEAYNRFIAAQGFEEEAARVIDAWSRGDRQAASDAISQDLVDALVLYGSPQRYKERLDSFRAAGLDVPVLGFVSFTGAPGVVELLEAMAPAG